MRNSTTPPAGVLRPVPERIEIDEEHSVMDMFHTDTQRRILWVDHRAGLGVIGAACRLMSYKINGRPYSIRKCSHWQLQKIKEHPAYRAAASQWEKVA